MTEWQEYRGTDYERIYPQKPFAQVFQTAMIENRFPDQNSPHIWPGCKWLCYEVFVFPTGKGGSIFSCYLEKAEQASEFIKSLGLEMKEVPKMISTEFRRYQA